jgi:hypothetical protein
VLRFTVLLDGQLGGDVRMETGAQTKWRASMRPAGSAWSPLRWLGAWVTTRIARPENSSLWTRLVGQGGEQSVNNLLPNTRYQEASSGTTK